MIFPTLFAIFEFDNTAMLFQEARFVQMAKDGQRGGVEALYHLYFDAMYRFCYWQSNRSEDAEDLTQDIFIEMAKSIRTFKGRSSFKNWLYTIAKRRISQWLRAKYQLPTSPLFEMIPHQEEWIDPSNTHLKEKVVSQLLAQLSGTESKVMKLRYLQSYTVKETAQSLRLTENNIKVIAYRSLKKLQKIVECNQEDTLFREHGHWGVHRQPIRHQG